MLRPPYHEAEVKDSPILDVPKEKKSKNCETDDGTISSEVEYIEKLLKIVNIEDFDVSYPTHVSPNIFTLRRISDSYCFLCDREYSNENAYVVPNKKKLTAIIVIKKHLNKTYYR